MAQQPIEIPISLSGVAAIKAEIRSLQGQIDQATDPKQMQDLAERAGQLKDRLKDVNEQVSIFATGSKFEAISNSFGMIGNDLMSLDFEGASEKAKIFNQTLTSLTPKEIGGQIKGLISTVGTLGKTFVQFGIQLLTNPIFLLVAVITAIVVAVGIFLNKIGVLQKVMKALMIPINAVIDLFKKMTDWLGLTTYAAEESAEKIAKAEEQNRKSIEKTAKTREDLYNLTADMSDEEVKQLEKRIGKQINLNKSLYDIQKDKVTQTKESVDREIESLNKITDMGGELTDEQKKQLSELKDKRRDLSQQEIEIERSKQKAIIDLNRKSFQTLQDWKTKNIKNENERAKAEFKIQEQRALAEIDIEIRKAKQLGQNTTLLEQTKNEIKKFYASEAQKVDKRVAEDEKKARQERAKEQREAANKAKDDYIKLKETEYKALQDAEALKIAKTKEGTQDRVNAEKDKLDAELGFLRKYQKEFKMSNDQLALIEADYQEKKIELQETFNTTVTDSVNRQAQAEAELLKLNATNNAERLNAAIKLVEVERDIALQNTELTIGEREKLIKQADIDISTLKVEANQAELKAMAEMLETEQSMLDFNLEHYKGNISGRVDLIEQAAQKELETIEAQRVAELSALDLSQSEKAAIEEKYRQARIVAEEGATEKIKALRQAELAKYQETAEKGLNAVQGLTDAVFASRLSKVKKGSEEEEKLMKKQFEANKKLQLAGAIMDGFKSVTASLAQAPIAIGAVPNPLGIASLAFAVATSAANIAKIASTQYDGGGGGGVEAPNPSLGGGGVSSTPASPSFNLVGQGNQANNLGASTPEEKNIVVTAVVSETQITSAQKLQAYYEEGSAL